MGRTAKKCQKKCQNHRFLLKPVHYSAILTRELEASFCPARLVDPSITPKFNKDKRYFTACFILPVDSVQIHQSQQKLESNEKYYEMEHERYKMENGHQKSNILIAKPRSKYSFCNICKQNYSDYLDHIGSEQHKKKINDNKFNGFIQEMCDVMKEKVRQEDFTKEDSKQQTLSTTLFSFCSQENLIFEEKANYKASPSFQGFDLRQINDLLYSSKAFHPFSELNDAKIPPQEENEAILTHHPYSPIKKCSEQTEGFRHISSIKPIILSGSQHCEIRN